MGTTAEKLNKVKQTKEAIKQSIIAKGVEVLDSDLFSTYPSKIDSIETGGGSGGDLVFAHNSMGKEIVAGDKVFLNKHNQIQDYKSPKLLSEKSEISQKYYAIWFDNNNNIYKEDTYRNNPNDGRGKYVWTGEKFKWTPLTALNVKNSDRMFIRSYKDESIMCTPWTKFPQRKLGDIIEYAPDRSYIGQGYWVTFTYPMEIYTQAQGGTQVGAIPINGAACTCIYLIGRQLFLSINAYRYLYDISNPSAPIQLRSAAFDPKVDNQASISYMTGLNVGSYVFSVEEMDFDHVTTLKVWKINEDYTFSLANDLPETLQQFVGQKVYFNFSNGSNLLTIGTKDLPNAVYLFKFENGQFYQIPFNVEVPSEVTGYQRQPSTFDISKDGTTAYISEHYFQSGGKDYVNTYAYRIKVADDGWYAETIQQVNEYSLSGFYTGNKDEQGLYEISTVLPKTEELIVNSTPEGAKVEVINGAVL